MRWCNRRTASVIDIDSGDDIDVSSEETMFEHYIAIVHAWRTEKLDEDDRNRWIKFIRQLQGVEVIDVSSIDCLVGRLTKTDESVWVITQGVHPIRNPIDPVI